MNLTLDFLEKLKVMLSLFFFMLMKQNFEDRSPFSIYLMIKMLLVWITCTIFLGRLIPILCVLQNRIKNFNSIDLLVSEILIFKLILICKFQNAPCALGFEVKYSKFFYRRFRAYIIILSMDFVIIELF